MTSADTISERNWQYYKARARNEVDEKCFDCEKFTIYGKTCRGVCTKK